MNLDEIINKNKKTIIFNDLGISDRDEIISSPTNLNLCFDILAKFHEEIIVVSKNVNKINVFEYALNNNVTVEFISLGILSKKEFDEEKFEDRIVLFDNCFDGMTSQANNTYINIKKISEISKKFVAYDNIGEKFLYMNYFPVLLSLFDKNISFENINEKDFDHLLFKYFVILSSGEMISSCNKNYWSDINNPCGSVSNVFDNYDISGKSFISSEKIQNGTNINSNKLIKKKVLVNKYLYICLTFFCGFIGFHKFYTRRYVVGILYFIFCWTYIPMLISIVELIIAIGINTDENGKFYI